MSILAYHHNELVTFLEEVRDASAEFGFISSKSEEKKLLNIIIDSKMVLVKQGRAAEAIGVKAPYLRKNIQPRLNEFLKAFSDKCNINPPIRLFFSSHGRYTGGHFACCHVEDDVSRSENFIRIDELQERLINARRILKITLDVTREGESSCVFKLLHAIPIDPNFVGRNEEIDFLNKAWVSSGTYLVSVIAWGGFGKSILVRHWLEQVKNPSFSRKPKKMLWWSFYQNKSIDAFIEASVTLLTPKNQKLKNLYHHTEEGFDVLISLLNEQPSILVLDGFEEMQYSQAGDYFGKCINYQLMNFIRRICEGDCPNCLCVITSRLPINGVNSFNNKSYFDINLEDRPLHVDDARRLLKSYGVKGSTDQLDSIIEDHGSHPLAMVTISTLLSNFFDGNAKKVMDMPSVTSPDSGIGNRFKLWSTFSWYDSLLSDTERYILRVISLFRQIAPWKLLFSFLKTDKESQKRICDLTLSEIEIKSVCFHLSQLRLIRFDIGTDTYTMHPLWKTFFELSIPNKDVINYHKLLFDILRQEALARPSTLQEMWPLIEAVYHGCKCGHIEESLNIFRERIERKAGYLTKNLAAWETKVDLCSMFFSNKRFSGQCLLDNFEEQGHLLNAAGFAYLNMGFPLRAMPLFDRAAEIYSNAHLSEDEGQVHRNRSDSFLRMGNLICAVNAANKALELDLSPKSQESSLGYIGYAHALMGAFDLAEQAFNKALLLCGQEWLPPIRGVQYVEMLIFKMEYEKAVEKIHKMLSWVKKQKILFSEAECIRVLAVVASELACSSNKHEKAQEAIRLVKKATNYANRAGVNYYIMRTILDSARIVLSLTFKNLNILTEQDFKSIERKVGEVLGTSEKSNYRLIEAEGAFVKAYLYLLKKDFIRANKEINHATNLARILQYYWLENKCCQLKSESNLM